MIKLKQLLEGTCGYGVGGKLGEKPAGPHLMKKIKAISKDYTRLSLVSYLREKMIKCKDN